MASSSPVSLYQSTISHHSTSKPFSKIPNLTIPSFSALIISNHLKDKIEGNDCLRDVRRLIMKDYGSQSSSTSSRSKHLRIRCASERQALFSRIAPVYDNLNDLLSLGQHRIWKRMAVSWTRAKVGDCVLDLCCGSGDLAFLLSEKVGSDGKVTGFDFSKEQLLMASSRQNLQAKSCYRNIVWLEGDATDLPFSDCHFDAITIGFGLRNIIDKRKAMQEVFRVLKPGSTVSVLDFNKNSNPVTASFQEWMIDNVVVPVARSYGLAKEYEYLKSSIQEFLTGKELEQLALDTGFSDAKHYEVGGGLMGNLVATR